MDSDIAAVTETWLNNTVANSHLTITGYNLVRHDRLCRKYGRLCMFVKHCLTITSVTVPPTPTHIGADSHESHELIYLDKCSQGYVFMLVYHPLRPRYKPESLLARLRNADVSE